MDKNGRLELEIVDAHGARLTEKVTVTLRHHVLKEELRAEVNDPSKIAAITGLRTEPQGLYVLEISAPSYRSISRFVTIPASGTLREQPIALPIRPERARAIFPTYDDLDPRVQALLERSTGVNGFQGRTGRELYDAMKDEPKAGLLNIAKKSLATQFKNGGDLLLRVTLLDAIGDRCFVDVPAELIAQMPALVDGDLFRPVNGSLHEAPSGFEPAGSFKTQDAFGNLQLTFFQSTQGRCMAEVDIDDAAGLGHVFQVMRNHLSGNPTHPFNIHQILIAHQHLDPGYRLVPA
jgi:hypothetical protein